MSLNLSIMEDQDRRQTWAEADGMAYRRVYYVPVGSLSSLPVEGDPMPGSNAALLGPFIEAGGITFGRQGQGGKQEVVLKCKLLAAARTVQTYSELVRKVIDRTAQQLVWRTVGVSLSQTDANAPTAGSALADTGMAVAPRCMAVRIDNRRYPGRFVFVASWTGPVLRTE